MKIREIFLYLSIILIFAACSKDGSGNKPSVNINDFNATEMSQGSFEVAVESSDNEPKAFEVLANWHKECDNVTGYKVPNLKAGVQFISREDEISIWPDFKPTGDVRYSDDVVERVVNSKKFISTNTQTNNNYSIKARFEHVASVGSYGSRMIGIIWTKPDNLKDIIEDNINSPDKDDGNDTSYVKCDYDDRNWDNDTNTKNFATMTLADGKTVSGILEIDRSELNNYVCAQYTQKDKLIRKKKIANKVIEEFQRFYSKALVNPFESNCHDSAGLYDMRVVKDASGNNKILELDKSEVLSVKGL